MLSQPSLGHKAGSNFRFRILRTAVLIFGIGLLPITLLGFVVFRVSSASTHELILANNQAAATLTQNLVQTEFEHRIRTLEGFAANPGFRERVETHDEEGVRDQLQVLVESQPRIERAFVTTPEALLWSDFPKASESLGVVFDHRDWYKGVSENWTTHVSGVYRRNAEPRLLLVAVAAPVRSSSGAVAGIVVYQIRLEGLTQLISDLQIGTHGYTVLVDHFGNVVAHPHLDLQEGEHSEYADSPLLLATRGSISRTMEYDDPITGIPMLSTSARCAVGGNFWVLIAQQPLKEAYAPVRLLALQIAGGVLLLSLVLIAGLVVLVSYETQLRDKNIQLDANNRELAEDNRERRRMYRTLLANLPGMVYRCKNDPRRTMEFLSAECEALTGYDPESLLLNSELAYPELIHPDDVLQAEEAIQRGIHNRHSFTMTYRIRTRTGEQRWVWERGRAVFDEQGKVVALEGFVSDITEQKLLEQQFLQSQKMEAIGQLAGGIAHDFNNLLTVINGYSAMLLDDHPEPSAWRNEVEEIERAGKRAAGLTRQLLAFSRKEVLKPEVLDLNQVVERMDKMLRRLIGENIDLVTLLSPSLHHIKFDPGHLEQIIMNLAINARDAMPEGGKLTLETANIELDETYVKLHPGAQTGEHVMIAVTDTGTGMDAAVQERIFDPFFTTKSVGKGTGLGLSTVFGIVKQSGGNIWVYSEPGRGTTFKVFLPLPESDTLPVQENSENPPDANGETVLVVEDEKGVRILVRMLLEKRGYTAIEASDGKSAVEALERHHAAIRVMLTDLVLTDMDGTELSRLAAKKYPNVRIIYMSGYTDKSISHSGALVPGAAFVEKPISPQDLFRKLGRALNS